MPVSWVERFSRSVLRHRRWWSTGALLVLAGSIALGARLSIRADLQDFLPRRGEPVPPAEIAVRTRLGAADRIVVLLESDDSIDVEPVAPLLDTLGTRLAALPGVRRVEYRVRPELLRFLEQEASAYLLSFFEPDQLKALGDRISRAAIRKALTAGERARNPLTVGVAADPLGVLAPPAAVLRRAIGGARLDQDQGYLTVPDRRAFLILVEPNQTLTDVRRARALVTAVEQVLQDARSHPTLAESLSGKRLLAVGRPVASVHAFETVVADGRRIAFAATVTTFGLLLLFFRRLRAPLFLLGTVAFGLALTGGTAFLIFGSVSVIAYLFVALLVGLGDEFAFYIATHYWIFAEPTNDRGFALASALRRPGRGLLISGLVMAAAFLSLVVVSYPVMTELAWITALGVLAMLVSSFVVLPIALSHTAPERRTESGWLRTMALAHLLGRRRGWSLLAWAAVVATSLGAARTIPFELHPWKLALRDNPSTAEMERVRQILGVWPSPLLMVSTGSTPEEALARDREAVAEMDRLALRAGVTTIESLTRWLPPPDQQQASIAYVRAHPDMFSPERFRRDFLAELSARSPPDPRLATEYVPQVSRLLTTAPKELNLEALRSMGLDSLIGRHLVAQGGEHLAITYLYLAQFPWAAGVVDRFEETLRLGGGPGVERARFIGDALRGATHVATLRRDMVLATVLALVLVGALLWAQFRRLTPALLCLLPVVCGVSAALGVMAALRIELNMLTLSVAPLVVGLSVDDGIHMMTRLEAGETTLTTLKESGAAMIITTLTTAAGFGCLGLARFAGVRELGLVGMSGILVALAASLHLLPICHSLVRRET